MTKQGAEKQLLKEAMMKRTGKMNEVHFMENKIIKWLCAVLLSVSPLLQHYKGFYQNAGFSALLVCMFLLLLTVAHEVIISKQGLLDFGKALFQKNKKAILCALPLLVYFIYSAVNHGITFTKVLYGGFMVLLFFLITSGFVEISYVFCCAAAICLLAFGLLAVQYICFYALGFHVQLVPVSALLTRSSAWIAGAKTGLIGINGASNGFYRPSAFFLEPSHLAIYCVPVVCLLLLSPEMTGKKLMIAAAVSAGVLLSTSGMGAVLIVCLWALYLLYYSRSYRETDAGKTFWSILFSKRNLFIVLLMILVMAAAYCSFGFVQKMVNRIFIPNVGTGNAISGRTRNAINLIKKMEGIQFLTGKSDNVKNISFNLPGFFSALYKNGIIGIFLSYAVYVIALVKGTGYQRWLSVIYIALSFFTAHTHGTFYMTFYFMFINMDFFIPALDERRFSGGKCS